MPLTLLASGAPFAGAILGVFAYRIFNLWLPLLPAAAAVPRLQRRYGPGFHARGGLTRADRSAER